MIFLFGTWSLVALKVRKYVGLNCFSSLWNNEFCLSDGHCLFLLWWVRTVRLSWLDSPFCISIVCSCLSLPFPKNCELSSCLHVWLDRKIPLLKNNKTPLTTQKTSLHLRNNDSSIAERGSILCPEALRTNTSKYKFSDVGWLKNPWVGMQRRR